MIRHCDGTDPNLIRDEPPWDPSQPPGVRDPDVHSERPCDCGLTFDDVDHMVIYPHPAVR